MKRFFSSIFFVLMLSLFFTFPASADSYPDSFDTVFHGTPYDPDIMGGWKNVDPVVYPSLPEGYEDCTYCFCAGMSGSGSAVFTNSPTLIWSPASSISGSLNAPDGFKLISFSYSVDYDPYSDTRYATYWDFGGDFWSASESSANDIPYIWSCSIYRNDCSIVDSEGNTLDTPLVDSNYQLSAFATTDKTIKFEVLCDSSEWWSCEFYIVPGGSESFSNVRSGYQAFNYLNSHDESDPNYESELEYIFSYFPILDHFGVDGTIRDVLQVIVSSGELASIPSRDFVSSAFSYVSFASELFSKFDWVKNNAYGGYYGTMAYNHSSPARWEFNVSQFYNNVHLDSRYSDGNTVYVLFYDPLGTPCAYATVGFVVSDFMPVDTPIMPDPSIIDGLPAYPDDSSMTDWTRYQHAMYMKYLAEMLARSFNTTVTVNNNDTPFECTADYDNSFSDTGYDYLDSIPDYDFDEGVPLDLVTPFTVFPLVFSDVIDCFDFGDIITVLVMISVACWFIYGRR